MDIVKRLSERSAGFSLHTTLSENLGQFKGELNKAEQELLAGTLRNRDITAVGKKLLAKRPLDHKRLGKLLSEHQAVLRDVLKISTEKIDRMINAALSAGAYGGKINGSGGGGCMFVYAPENPREVAEAIERAGGRAYIVSVDKGTRNE
jgi:galactokinase